MRNFSVYLNPLWQQFQAWLNPGKGIKRLLRQAAGYLPPDVVALPNVSRETFQDFYLYLAEDEFELAMEVLEELASGARPPASFWKLLTRVAEQMNCEPQAQRYRINSQMK